MKSTKRSTVSRVLYNINRIKNSVNSDPHKGVSQTSFMSEVARALREAKILINYGTANTPVYSFSETVKVDETLAEEITKNIKRYRETHYPYMYRNSNKPLEDSVAENPNEPAKEPEKTTEYIAESLKDDWINLPKDDITKINLSVFSDEEIWNELKSRGYEASAGCIRKTVYVELC